MTYALKTVLVTGATAGFGHAIALRLVKDGYRVIATGRRQERLDALAQEAGPALLPFRLDVTDLAAVQALPGSLPEGWQEVDVLVNNAGLALGLDKAWEARLSDWERMIATNVTGLVEITRMLLPGMVARNKGHVVSLGSTAGTYPYPGANVYGATKAFVDQFMQNLRSDLLGKQVRATTIAPGLCGGSEFSAVRLGDKAQADAVYKGTKPLLPEDIAETVAWVLAQPAHVNINHVEMMPICQASAGLAVDRTMAG
ncbi:SDR family NAD(P)-dependent oxidoreductase [Acetobacter farinalis]|uniref:SDR family NAD(P)-dependent oxidoreductase n=1 Tax=Acetobacter farinalis TaxID=1260984 RepID=A0ABT3Q8S3_9PROT|nr:SDR family NAD(P)-dependent oxidoreductase [Acetobacter farinalis]MCX2561677.1 SDR family NAD(P)-dependent oxidoreductase [Acetobacter farinalis]NHO30174.1 SDR family NAD(P)-dependent oxidoreductase [Acetobacter farinalis]